MSTLKKWDSCSFWTMEEVTTPRYWKVTSLGFMDSRYYSCLYCAGEQPDLSLCLLLPFFFRINYVCPCGFLFRLFPWGQRKIRKTVANWSHWLVITGSGKKPGGLSLRCRSALIGQTRPTLTALACTLACLRWKRPVTRLSRHIYQRPKVTNTGNLRFSGYRANHVLLLWTSHAMFILLESKQVSYIYILYKRIQCNFCIGKKKSKGVNIVVFSSASRVAVEF